MKTFGQILREKRLSYDDLSQKKLAKALGVAKNTVYNWENGKAAPSMFNLIDLADIFECSIDELVGRK